MARRLRRPNVCMYVLPPPTLGAAMRYTAYITTVPTPRCWCSSGIECIWWSTAPLITTARGFGRSKTERPGALDEAGRCAGVPCPFVYGVAGLSCRAEFRLGIHGLANFPWTPPMRRNRAAIALGDKIKSPQPSFGDRPSPSKKKWDSCRAERRSKRGTFFWPACMARTTEEG